MKQGRVTFVRPTVYRPRTDAITAPLLEMGQDELMLGRDRLLTDPTGGGLALHRFPLPMERIEATPSPSNPPPPRPRRTHYSSGTNGSPPASPSPTSARP
ncbi:hypothetical protein ACFP3U_30810 [Kitasatospora misakiensis]|uniref:Uncharacterized protein n=1 Tax=Kitasatospora misakiensis TaxID=67330 RepID=A0ABW0X9X0_9ACTN